MCNKSVINITLEIERRPPLRINTIITTQLLLLPLQVVLFYMHTNNNRTHCCSAYLSFCDRTTSDANLLAIRTLFIALTTS